MQPVFLSIQTVRKKCGLFAGRWRKQRMGEEGFYTTVSLLKSTRYKGYLFFTLLDTTKLEVPRLGFNQGPVNFNIFIFI